MRNRRDGKQVKMNGFDKFLYYLKPRRSDSEVYINREIDVTNLVNYMDKKKKENKNITYFHLFSTAIGKTFYNCPLLNRFIIRGRKYQRNDVSISFVAKTQFTDNASELLKVIKIKEKDNVNTISKKISGDVKKIRSNETSDADKFADLLGKLPRFIMAIGVWIVKRLDNHDLLPASLTSDSIYHSSVILSNLGSIHCGGIYHNLTNFGTSSFLATIGEIHKEKLLDENGKEYIADICDLRKSGN